MRNLQLLSVAQHKLSSRSEDAAPIKWISAGMSTVMCCSSERFFTFQEDAKESLDQAIPPEHLHIVGTEYLIAENAVFLATAEGSLLICWGAEMVTFSYLRGILSTVH